MTEEKNPLYEEDDYLEEEKPSSVAEASLKLINLLYDTPDDRLLDLAVIPKSQPLKIARLMAMNQCLNTDLHEYENWINPDTGQWEQRIKRFVTIDEVATRLYLHATRGVGGKLLDIGSVHTEAQILEDEEEIYEEYQDM